MNRASLLRALLPAAASLSVALLLQPNATADVPERIRLQLKEFKNSTGQALCYLWSTDEGFPQKVERALATTTAPIQGNASTCDFEKIAPGTYAIAVVHDENKNGKMDTNFLGIPKEGYAFTKDARGFIGPPKFKDAKFTYNGGALLMQAKVTYP